MCPLKWGTTWRKIEVQMDGENRRRGIKVGLERGSGDEGDLLATIFLIINLSPSWLARTDPKDVARVESKTVIVTPSQRDTVPIPTGGARGQLGNWMSPAEFQQAVDERFPGCMQGNQGRDTEARMVLIGWNPSSR